jgi:CheY-like chemotaxis protein
MDLTTLAVGAGLYAAAAVARQAEDEFAGAAWKALRKGLKRLLGRDPAPTDVTPQLIGQIAASDRHVAGALTNLWIGSGVLRRAKVVKPALEGARVLWIDDNPAGNALERDCLKALGVDVQTAESTRSAITCLGSQTFDLVLSDIDRAESPTAGLLDLPMVRKEASGAPVVFYIMNLQDRGVPAGAFGIAARPDELLHLCMDVLERRRL